MQFKLSSQKIATVFSKLLSTYIYIIIFLSFSACINGYPSNHTLTVSEVQRESFVLVLVSFEGTPQKCLGSQKICAITPHPDKTWKMNIKGSGVVIRHVNTETYVMTAGHVCSQDMPTKISFKKIPFTLETKTKIKFYDIWGNSHQGDIIHVDHENDICVVKSAGTWGRPVRLASRVPKPGERIFNIAAPYGIYSPGMVPIFEGFYCGSDTLKNAFYSIPTKPGSSGSPVFNKEGKLISLIHSSSIMLESLGLGCALENLQEIVKAYIPKPHYPERQ